MRIVFFLFILSLFFPVVAICAEKSPQESRPALVDGGDFDCLPVHNFGLAGLRLWQPESSITGKLGAPLQVTKSTGEDDGGSYVLTIYHYRDLRVEAVRDQIDRITTESAAMPMPSGIRVGDSQAEVIRKFGRKPRDLEEDDRELQIVTCPQNGKWIQEDYVILTFDAGQRLLSIAYEANRP